MPRFCAATIAAMLVIAAATVQANDDEAALTAELELIGRPTRERRGGPSTPTKRS
jgi:hypothetical protein